MKLSISDITFVGPFIGRKSGIISWVIDIEDKALDLTIKDILGIERIVF
jgi:hypothetical protein